MKNLSNNHLILMLLFVCMNAGVIGAQELSSKVTERKMASSILKKEVKLLVSLPDGYAASKKRYAVLYFLHGTNKTVEEIAAICKKSHQDKRSAEMIVVSIDDAENIDRTSADYTAYDQYLSFMEKELIPVIGKRYRTNGQKILYGKSMSGSFPLYAFLSKPALFNGYIAASKGWYEKNNDAFTALANQKLQNSDIFKGKKVFLASLNGAYNNQNIPEVNEQMTAFATLLETKSGAQISARYQAFDDWGITPQPGFKDGLLFVSQKSGSAKVNPLTMQQTNDGKWVIMDRNKQTIYEVFLYDNGPDYPSDGLIRVVKNGKIGYADAKTYEIVIAPQFDCAFPFENGKAKVSNQCQTVKEGEYSIWKSDNWQYVDKQGKF